MTDPVSSVFASDQAVTALADRRTPPDEQVLTVLSAWARELDKRPKAPIRFDSPMPTERRPHTRPGRAAAVLTVALTLSSSGIAAATAGDPLLPIHFVAAKLYSIGHPGDEHQSKSMRQQDRSRLEGHDSHTTAPRVAARPARGGLRPGESRAGVARSAPVRASRDPAADRAAAWTCAPVRWPDGADACRSAE